MVNGERFTVKIRTLEKVLGAYQGPIKEVIRRQDGRGMDWVDSVTLTPQDISGLIVEQGRQFIGVMSNRGERALNPGVVEYMVDCSLLDGRMVRVSWEHYNRRKGRIAYDHVTGVSITGYKVA